MMKFRNHIVITLQILTVVKSQLTVRTGYIEVEGTGATFDCSIGNQSFDSSFTRQWKAPINQNNLVLVINGGNTVVSGYDESLMNATIGFISMTTPRLEWTVENKKFECSYGFSVHSINATHDILATEGTYKFTDDADKCEIEWKNVLPLPSTVAVTNIKGSAETDISNVQGKVLTTSKNNSDQGRTHDFTLTIQKTDLEADSVRIQVVAGPYTKTETCNLTGTGTTEMTTTEAFTTSQDLSSASSSVSPDITSDNNVVSSSTGAISSSEPTTKSFENETNNTGLSREDIILISVLGGVGFLLLVVIGIVVICCCVRSQKGRQHNKSKVQRKIKNGKSKHDFDNPVQQGLKNHQQGDRFKHSESRMSESRQGHYKMQNISSGTGHHQHQFYRGGSDSQHRNQENRLYPKLEMHQYGHSNSGYYPNEAYHARRNDHYNDPYYGRQPQYYHRRGNYTQSVGGIDRRQYEANWMY